MEKMFKFLNFGTLILACIALSLGILGGFFIPRESNILCDTDYRFINVEIACGKADVIRKTGYIDLKKEILSYIASEEEKSVVDHVSVYFRDLHHGPVFGIDELETFAPASLIKMPLAIMYLKVEEEKPGLLSRSVQFVTPPGGEVPQPFAPSEKLQEGAHYTLEKLLFNMVAYSDNTAAQILVDSLSAIEGGEDILANTFKELGIVQAESKGDETVTVRGYASLFTFLYNTSYLNDASSNTMLGWLTRADFKEGLVKLVPKDTVVAHKFGTRGDKNGNKQLHDCGIVYYPDNPYLLCIMTKGDDWGELSSVIAHISRMVYEEVDSRRL